MTNNELHEEESCRNLVCSPPETLELDTCGNAAKENQTSGMNGFLSHWVCQPTEKRKKD